MSNPLNMGMQLQPQAQGQIPDFEQLYQQFVQIFTGPQNVNAGCGCNGGF